MNTKKTIITILVAIAIIVGAYFLFTGNKQVGNETRNTLPENVERRGGGDRPPQNIDLPEDWDDMSEEERRDYMSENRPDSGNRPGGGRPDRGEQPE